MILATLEVADRYLNHPQIKPAHGIAQDQFVSLAPVWADVVCFEFPSGCIAFHKRGDAWDGHLMFIPGSKPDNDVRKALAAMLRRVDCQKVSFPVGYGNVRAERFLARIGCRRDGTTWIIDKEVG